MSKPIGSIPSGGSIPSSGQRVRGRRRGGQSVSTRAPRVWVFAKEPKFARFQRKLQVQRLNEPAIDVFDQADQVTLIAQLPGISRDGIDLHIEGDLVIIEALGMLSVGQVKYYREVLLPFEVETVPQKLTLNNGVLEIDLRRMKSARGSKKRKGTAT